MKKLPHNCNSWCVVVRHTGDVVREIWDERLADRIVRDEGERFEVIPTIEWLQRFNASVRNAK
jgi:hypothetical protein